MVRPLLERGVMRKVLSLGFFVAMAGCLSDVATDDKPKERKVASVSQAMASWMGGHEASIDAPWRLEPDPSAGLLYPKIPIVLSVMDGSMQTDPATKQPLGRVCEVVVREEEPDITKPPHITRFPGRGAEVERSDKWPYSSDVAGNHHLCRGGESCPDADLDVGTSAEWHGTYLFTPRNQTPGADLQLTVQARIAPAGGSCGSGQTIVDWDAPTSFGRFSPMSWNVVNGQYVSGYAMTSRLEVHLGDAPLPKFDDEWVYGDLHYHSQGTDNEGESGYAYRPTLQAMRAMGLDFLFATDHASDSGQTTDIDEIYVDNIHLPYVPSAIEDFLERLAASKAIGAETDTNAARDMNPQRFAAMRAWLNGPNGGNAEVMRLAGRFHAPRIFLGGEVDVIPEISPAERSAHALSYGNGKAYFWGSACEDVPGVLKTLETWTTASACHSVDDLVEPSSDGTSFLVKDVQGLGDLYFARQHLVHLPKDGTRDDAFASSRTTLYGGAWRRLKDLLREEYAIGNKGYAFLAHPVAAASGDGMGRLGPDIVPYSDTQLMTAFRSQAVLGLQLWNEDNRLATEHDSGFPLQGTDLPFGFSKFRWGQWNAPDAEYDALADGTAAWEKMLLWGMQPSKTAGIPWLAPGAPRKVFMAGGSDAHGDWNYRQEGSIDGVSRVVDTAIGKPRNLLHVGPDRPETTYDGATGAFHTVGQTQVTDALASGKFAVTDGPALRVAIDTNGNGAIDAADIPMGGLASVPSENATLPFIVEWKSTPEWGPVAEIDLYVGATKDDVEKGVVYATDDHGVHSAKRSGAKDTRPFADTNGVVHYQTYDGYLLDPNGKLHITPSAGEAMAGKRVVYLRANDYVLGKTRVVYPDPICYEDPSCAPLAPGGCPIICKPPGPAKFYFDDVARPDHLFVRAFAKTAPRAAPALCVRGPSPSIEAQTAQLNGQCIERLAYTNPIWVNNATCVSQPVETTCGGKQCGPAVDNCGKPVTCPNTCGAGTLCGGGSGGPNACGCQTDTQACAGKSCGTTVNNCGATVTCANHCSAPNTCGGGGSGPNQCGCTSNGNPCGLQCAGTATDNCGNVYQCRASCGMEGQCPAKGGQCYANFCKCKSGPAN